MSVDLLCSRVCKTGMTFRIKAVYLENAGNSSCCVLDWRVFKVETGTLNEEDKSVVKRQKFYLKVVLVLFLCWFYDYNPYVVMIRS